MLDSGYRGEVLFKFKPASLIVKWGFDYSGSVENEFDSETMRVGHPDIEDYRDYNVGDRIGQIIILPYPKIEFEEVQELSDSERGVGGYGSTGN